MPRKRHVSRNIDEGQEYTSDEVMPRKRHVSRNLDRDTMIFPMESCLARGM